MRTCDLEDLRAEVDDLVEHRTTALAPAPMRLDGSWYTAAGDADLERARLFERFPLVACTSAEVAAPGAVLARQVASWPVIVVRRPDGAVGAFVNSCRHRGTAVVAEGCDVRSRLTCPYHGWTYRLDGTLAARPNPAAFATGGPGAARGEPRRRAADEDVRLVELPVAEAHGLVWVTLDPSGRCDPDEALGGLGEELAAMELDRFVVERTIERTVAVNWMLVVDGFLETYHVRHLHPTTLSPHLPSDLAAFRPFGPHGRMTAPRRRYEPGGSSSERFLRDVIIVYQLFPNGILSWLTDHFELWQLQPDGAGRTTVRLQFLVRPEGLEDRSPWDANQRIVEETVFGEDWVAARGAQVALDRLGPGAEMVAGRNEPALQHFHREVLAAIGG